MIQQSAIEAAHYAACAFGGNRTVEEAKATWPFADLDQRRRDGIKAMLEAAMAASIQTAYAYQMNSERLIAALQKIANGCPEPETVARKALNSKVHP